MSSVANFNFAGSSARTKKKKNKHGTEEHQLVEHREQQNSEERKQNKIRAPIPLNIFQPIRQISTRTRLAESAKITTGKLDEMEAEEHTAS